MVRNLLNEGGSTTSVVITNRMNATLPLEQTQASFTDPILIAMKGLNGFGGAGKLIKVNSTNDGLEYGDDDGSNWTYSNPNLFIKTGSTATNLLIGTSTNSTNPATLANYKFISKGTSLFDGFTVVYDDTTVSNNRLNIGTDNVPSGNANTHGMLYIKTSSGFTDKAILIESKSAQSDVDLVFRGGYTGGQDATIRWNGATGNGTLNYLQFQDADRYTFDDDIFFTSSHTFNLNSGDIQDGTWNGNTISVGKGGTGLTSYSTGDIIYATSSTTLAKLTIGDTGQILKVASNAIPEWVNDTAPDLSTSTNFGTSATSDVNVGNNQGTSASVGLKLYGDEFLLHNTSNVNVATFTPQSNTCNLSLNGGVISSASWSGSVITVAKGGTGFTSYSTGDILYASGATTLEKLTLGSPGKILKVNTGGTAPEWADAQSEIWDLTNGIITPITSTNVLRLESGLRIGTASEYVDIDYNTTNNNFKLTHSDGDIFFDYDQDTTAFSLSSKLFTLSSGVGANGDCLLLIQADTDDSDETANPKIQLQQDGGSTNAFIELDNNDFKIGGTQSGSDTVLYTNAGVVAISNNSGSSKNIATFSSSLADLKSTITQVETLRVGTSSESVDIGYNGTSNVFSLTHTGGNFYSYDQDTKQHLWDSTQFTISANAGSNGDSLLLLQSDTNNATSTSNPIFQLSQKGGTNNAYIELDSNSNFNIGTNTTSSNVMIYNNGGQGEIQFSDNNASSANIATFTGDEIDLKATETICNTVKFSTLKGKSSNTPPRIDEITASSSFLFTSGSEEKLFQLGGSSLQNSYEATLGRVGTGTPMRISLNSIGTVYDIINGDNATSGVIHGFTGAVRSGEFRGDSNSSNAIFDDATSFQIQSGNASFVLALRPSGRTIFPYLGSPSTSVVYQIHINTISGNPYEIHNTDNTQSGFQHYLNGEEVSMCSDRASYYREGSYVYFYNPLGTNGDHTFAGSYYAYHDNGSAIYFNLPSGGTSSGHYISFATANSQIARIDMAGSGRITGSWTGSWSGTSDRRLKENIVPIENAVDTLMKINVYQFDKYDLDNYDVIHNEEGEDTLKPFKERLSENTRFVYGFIAQEICENTPELGKMCVETNDWGDEEPAYIIDDRPMLACAIKTIQEQQATIQEQQAEINTLKEEVNTYKSIIDKLIKAPSFKSFKESLA